MGQKDGPFCSADTREGCAWMGREHILITKGDSLSHSVEVAGGIPSV